MKKPNALALTLLLATGLALAADPAALAPRAGVESAARGAGAKRRHDAVREEAKVLVGADRESWQLVWKGGPEESECSPADPDMVITCSCEGFGYAEAGRLLLVRRGGRNASEDLNLSPYFGALGVDNPVSYDKGRRAVLTRWGEMRRDPDPHPFDSPVRSGPPVDGEVWQPAAPPVPKPADLSDRWGETRVEPNGQADADRFLRDDPTLEAEIRQRPAPTIMKLEDYDHDGRRTEFLLHVGNMPCGKQYVIAVGISTQNPHLHAFGSAVKPNKPLLLPRRAWEALLTGPGTHTIVEWECDDHSSEVHQLLLVSAKNGTIRAKRQNYACPFDPKQPRLIEESDP